MNTLYILLGANLGEPAVQLNNAQRLVRNLIGEVLLTSSIYESDAWGVTDQPVFLNQILKVVTALSAVDCLERCQQIENQLGRVRELKWGARIIDVDILYYNDEIIQLEQLTIPHPYIQMRNFTLYPLVEIAPDFVHPVLRETNKALLRLSKDTLHVRKIEL